MRPSLSVGLDLCEPLESRTLLAAFTGAPFLDAPAPIVGGNDSHSILFTEQRTPAGSTTPTQWVRMHDAWVPLEDVPGFGPNTSVFGVNDTGTMYGREGADDYFFVSGGIRTRLADSITTWVGRAADSQYITIHGIADDGSSLIVEGEIIQNIVYNRSWRLRQGVATYLGDYVCTMNSAGSVLTLAENNTGHLPNILFLSDGSQVTVDGIGPNAVLRDDDAVVWLDGLAENVNLLVWKDGVTTRTALPYLNGSSLFGFLRYTLIDANTRGQALVTRTGLANSDHETIPYIVDTDGSVRRVEDVVWGVGHYAGLSFPRDAAFLCNDGTLVTQTGVLTPIDEGAPWIARDGTPIAAAADEGSTLVGGVNAFGDAVVLVREGNTWSGYRVNGVDAAEFGNFSGKAQIHNVLPFFDRREGKLRAFVITDTRTHWCSAPDPSEQQFGERHSFVAELVAGQPLGATSLNNPVVFQSADDRVHLAGLSPGGDLYMIYQWDFASGVAWGTTNITADHLEAQGKTFAPANSNLTAFVTPWGAMHIAYLDAAGNVQVVWWAPGMTYWTTDNLSQIAGSVPLHGSLTSYVTAWNGLNIAGTDADGHLEAIWWVPQFGSTWKFERYAGDDAPKLDPDSLSSFVTPWGGLNVIGLNATTHEITVYWWTPATNQWRTEPIAVTGGPASVTARSAPVGAATADGHLQVFFADDNLHLSRLFWSPEDGATWNLEDITAAV